MNQRFSAFLKARWKLLLALLILLLSGKPILIEATIISDSFRRFLLSIDGATGIKTDIAVRAESLPSERCYRTLSECYVSLRHDYERGFAPPKRPNASAVFRTAFAGFATWNCSGSSYPVEEARFESLFAKTFGNSHSSGR